ncbi:MAG: tyrosine-type recombinase/integrase [Thermaceae bacterium]
MTPPCGGPKGRCGKATYPTSRLTPGTFAWNGGTRSGGYSATFKLAEAGVDLDAVKDLLGHESLATTGIYVHASRERLRRAVEKLPNPLER